MRSGLGSLPGSAILRRGGRLDRYVGRLFCLSYLTAFFLVVGLYLILDMATQIDEYMRPGEDGETPSIWTVARYYGLQLPFLYLQMSPFVTLVAGLFTASKMSRFNEVVAALNAGVSSRRLLLPVFAGAALLGSGMFLLREWATEELGRRRDLLQDRLLERRVAPVYENFWVRAERSRMVRVEAYRPAAAPGHVPEIRGLSSRFRDGRLSISIYADRAVWDPGAATWKLENGQRWETGPLAKEQRRIDVLDDVQFRPRDVELDWKGRERPIDLSFSEVRALLERDPTNSQYHTLLHSHLAFPFAGIVLLLVGMPFVLSQQRGGAVERVAYGFLLCVGYFGADFVTRTLGLQGQLGAVHAGWLPIVVFGSLGAVLYGSMRS